MHMSPPTPTKSFEATMTANQMLEFMNRTPFEIHLSDGAVIQVDEPYSIATRPHSQSCVVFVDDEVARHVAYRNITEVITRPMNRAQATR
jgi:hypothetical protein